MSRFRVCEVSDSCCRLQLLVSSFAVFAYLSVGPGMGPVDAASANTAHAAKRRSASSVGKKKNVTSAQTNARKPAASSKSNNLTTQKARANEARNARARQLLEAGARMHGSGHPEQAENLFRRAVSINPQSPDAFFNLGALAEGRGDFVSALGHYRAGLALRPSDVELKDAVDSMEKKLESSTPELTDNFEHPPLPFSGNSPDAPILSVSQGDGGFSGSGNVCESDLPLLNVTTPSYSSVPAYAPPVAIQNVPAPSFQLHSSMNSLSGGSSSYQSPLVSQNAIVAPSSTPAPSRRSVSGNVSRGAFRTILNVGVGAALRAGGLHCPRCNLFGLGF